MSNYGLPIHVATFYERDSATGLRYFVGRIGPASAACCPARAPKTGLRLAA
jgi:hypothetical protein